MEKPLTITVVTPSYNQGRYLAETIESVLGQAGDFYLDYIIVDGGSTDNSVEIIKRYDSLLREGKWSVKCIGIHYRWVSEKDNGQTDALMKGFRMADGEILAWLNSDDVYMPGALESVAAFLRENAGTALVYGDAYYCNPAGDIIGRYPTEEFDLNRLAYFNFICQPSTFFRKEVFETVGGLDGSLRFGMDFDLFVRIVKRFNCRHLPLYLSGYRLHEASKTMGDNFLFESHKESVLLALKHFGWAPLNLVYGSCYYLCLLRLPRLMTRFRLPVIVAALFCTLARSLWLNKGLRRADLKLLTRSNIRKIIKNRREILLG
jgi:glycosyltransferase involved in cell wall biosynthesis